MSLAMVAERLLWSALGGVLVLVLVLSISRVKALHPGVRTWLCRLAMVKMVLGLLLPFHAVLSMRTISSTWVTNELILFVEAIWLMGMLVVLRSCAKAYFAANTLRRLGRRNTAEASAELPSNLEVVRVECLREPCVVGTFRVALLLPAYGKIDPPVVRHEMAHIRHADPLFTLLGWLTYALFWFVPGTGRLVKEHSFWQEAWADLSAREELQLSPEKQASALLEAVAKPWDAGASLAHRGDALLVKRRIEAMFAKGYSKSLAVIAIVAILLCMVPIRITTPSRVFEARELFVPVRLRT